MDSTDFGRLVISTIDDLREDIRVLAMRMEGNATKLNALIDANAIKLDSVLDDQMKVKVVSRFFLRLVAALGAIASFGWGVWVWIFPHTPH